VIGKQENLENNIRHFSEKAKGLGRATVIDESKATNPSYTKGYL
jgi:hypothetical protein